MILKYILAFDADDLQEAKKTVRNVHAHQDITLGIKITDRTLRYPIHGELSSIEFPYAILLDLEPHNSPETAGDTLQKIAQSLLPFLLDPGYLRHSNEKILFLLSGSVMDERSAGLKQCLADLGLHNVRVIQHSGPLVNPAAALKSGPGGIAELRMPGFEEYISTESDRWLLFHTPVSNLADCLGLLSGTIGNYLHSNANIVRQHHFNGVQEENLQLKETIAILNKNIVDLNNYYRYVRGETTFKHHNRGDEGGGASSSPVNEPGLAGLFISDQTDKGKYLAYYTSVYEDLPGFYKKFATILKIILGRRELRYYLNKQHRKAFLDLIHTQSEEKQVQLWYYYEYEVLPGWYKKLGKLIKRK